MAVKDLEQIVGMHPVQYRFFHCRKTYVAYCAGRGAGKTFAGAAKLLHNAIAKPNRYYMASSPTYKMLKDSPIRTTLGLAKKIGVFGSYHQTDHELTLVNGTKILFRSADDPEKLRGPNLSGVWLDEAGEIDQRAFDVAIACLREGGVMGQIFLTFTPKGKKHWTYGAFHGQNPQYTELFTCRTRDNPFLPDNFEDVLASKYTAHYALQELAGEFIDGDGLMFKRSWFEKFEKHIPMQARRVRYWDKAALENAGCYTCGVLMASTPNGLYYVEDVVRGQWDPDERDRIIKATSYADRGRYGNVRIILEQEPGSSGIDSFKAIAKMLAGFAVFADKVTGNKATRAEPLAAQFGAGNVYMKEDAPWLADFIEEHTCFPGSKLKDQVDATAGAFNHLAKGGGFSGPVAGGTPSGATTGGGNNGNSHKGGSKPAGGLLTAGGNPFNGNKGMSIR